MISTIYFLLCIFSLLILISCCAAKNLEGKRTCKHFVQKGLGLAYGDRVSDTTTKIPLVVCITRLVAQKGLHLITRAIKRVEELVSLLLLLKQFTSMHGFGGFNTKNMDLHK